MCQLVTVVESQSREIVSSGRGVGLVRSYETVPSVLCIFYTHTHTHTQKRNENQNNNNNNNNNDDDDYYYHCWYSSRCPLLSVCFPIVRKWGKRDNLLVVEQGEWGDVELCVPVVCVSWMMSQSKCLKINKRELFLFLNVFVWLVFFFPPLVRIKQNKGGGRKAFLNRNYTVEWWPEKGGVGWVTLGSRSYPNEWANNTHRHKIKIQN